MKIKAEIPIVAKARRSALTRFEAIPASMFEKEVSPKAWRMLALLAGVARVAQVLCSDERGQGSE